MNNFYNVELPSLEKALELTKKFKRPVGHSIMIIGSVAPMVTKAGVNISEAVQKQHQGQVNSNGMLVVHSPFKKEGVVEDVNAVFPGDTIIYEIGTQAQLLTTITSKDLIKGLELPFGTIPTSEMYQKYVVMIIRTHNVVALLNK